MNLPAPATQADPSGALATLAKRTEKITKLFLVLGMEGTPAKIAGWVEATEHIPLLPLMLGCRDLVRGWVRSDGFPLPGDLVRYARPHVSRHEVLETARAKALPAPSGELVSIASEVDALEASLRS